jgi:hypothetical protein
MNLFLVAVFLATLNSKLVDLIKQPILQAKSDANLWYFSYVSVATGIILNWFAQVNLLSEYVTDPNVGVIITGIGIGAGSWFLYEVFMDKPARVTTTATAERGGAISSGALEVTAAPEVTEKDEWNA